jgi:hypothetical protein
VWGGWWCAVARLLLSVSPLTGGEARQIALQLDLPVERMKIVHKGRLLTPGVTHGRDAHHLHATHIPPHHLLTTWSSTHSSENINRMLRDDPKAVVQVLGSRAAVMRRPLTSRLWGSWNAAMGFVINIVPSCVREPSILAWERCKRVLLAVLYGVLEFLRTFMPGELVTCRLQLCSECLF